MSELTDHIMTRQQAEEEMACLRKIFPIVRLLDRKTLAEQPCYPPWKNAHPCTSCVGREALAGKCQCTKLETMGSKHYQAIARYVEIDGEPSVIEMVLPLDSGALRTLHSDEQLYTDPLIGAYNRRFYEEELKHKYLNAGVAMIDLDDFKLCNDTYGHSAGDAALRLTASIIHRCIRSTDMLVRYGGDELLLVLPNISAGHFVQKLRYISKRLSTAHLPEFSKLQLSASIGGMMAADIPISDAVVVADKRMYLAKRCKNTVVTEDVAPNSVCSGNAHRPTVLIVDDSPMNRDILSEILSDDFEVLEASNGAECLEILDARGPELSILLLDIVMPDMDGFDVLSAMNRDHSIEDIPVIMISSDDSNAVIRKSYELGASDYVNRPFDARIVYRRVTNTIKLYAKQRRLVQMVSDQIRARENNTDTLVGVLSHIVEFRNGESGAHVRHIRTITEMLLHRLLENSNKYSISAEQQDEIPLASALHDIGKIGIDEKILNKPGKLTPEEFEVMKTHSMLGAEMLHDLDNFGEQPLLQTAYEIARWHHERWDGRGYPDGLKGDEIPISAQLVSLADVYDALTSERCYKKAFSHEKAVQMILNGECGAFNPLLLQCLTDVQTDLKEELRQHD